VLFDVSGEFGMGSKKLVQAERHDLCHVNVFGNIQFFEQQVRPVVQADLQPFRS